MKYWQCTSVHVRRRVEDARRPSNFHIKFLRASCKSNTVLPACGFGTTALRGPYALSTRGHAGRGVHTPPERTQGHAMNVCQPAAVTAGTWSLMFSVPLSALQGCLFVLLVLVLCSSRCFFLFFLFFFFLFFFFLFFLVLVLLLVLVLVLLLFSAVFVFSFSSSSSFL